MRKPRKNQRSENFDSSSLLHVEGYVPKYGIFYGGYTVYKQSM